MSIGPELTPMVKYLIIAAVAVFLLQMAAGRELMMIFGIVPYWVITKLFIWQPATYLFLHGGFWHILFNMFGLWMFGCELERYWGSREFLKFFFITGVGAGVLSVVVDPFSMAPIIGASGAVYGILMAFGMMFPDRYVYLYFLFPVKVKYFVAVLGAMTFFSALGSPGSPIAHMAHLGGMLLAFLYLKGWLRPAGIRESYYRWRLKSMRKRFEVYENERRKKDKDYWIH